MSLDPGYLDYPKRSEGYDHALYPYRALHEAKPVQWPGGKRVATWLCVSLEWFPITPEDKPFRAPGHMQTAYPDYRHYTARDYGNRVGVYRLLDAFAKVGVPASFAINSAVAERYPVLLRDIVTAGHEVIAHSTDMNGTIASTLPEAEERALILRARDRLAEASGKAPRGWLSIARQQSFRTADLLKEADFDYCCDWVNDELPWAFNNGLFNLPLNHELSDRQILNVQQQSVDSYAEQICDAHDWLASDAVAQSTARMLPLHLTPYIIGLPYRMDAFEGLLANLKSRPETWFARGADLLDSYRSQL